MNSWTLLIYSSHLCILHYLAIVNLSNAFILVFAARSLDEQRYPLGQLYTIALSFLYLATQVTRLNNQIIHNLTQSTVLYTNASRVQKPAQRRILSFIIIRVMIIIHFSYLSSNFTGSEKVQDSVSLFDSSRF